MGKDVDQMQPVLILLRSISVMASVALRRCLFHPGGIVYRWSKQRIQRESKKQERRNEEIREYQHFLLQISGFSVFLISLLMFLLSRYWNFSPLWSLAVVVANGLDEWTKKWETKKHDVNLLRSHLRERLAPVEKDTGAESDSSESFDPEKHT